MGGRHEEEKVCGRRIKEKQWKLKATQAEVFDQYSDFFYIFWASSIYDQLRPCAEKE